jgi:hypothetical protein
MGWLAAAWMVGSIAGCDPAGAPATDAPPNPCAQVSEYTCSSPDYCDEVYDAASASELEDLCDGDDDVALPGRCDHTACCYSEAGLFGRPSMHCVTGDLVVGYRGVCEGRGDLYCER